MVEDENGNVLKFRLVRKKPFEILAESMPPCRVVVHNLTMDDVAKIQKVVEREHKVNVIKKKIVTLPGE